MGKYEKIIWKLLILGVVYILGAHHLYTEQILDYSVIRIFNFLVLVPVMVGTVALLILGNEGEERKKIYVVLGCLAVSVTIRLLLKR